MGRLIFNPAFSEINISRYQRSLLYRIVLNKSTDETFGDDILNQKKEDLKKLAEDLIINKYCPWYDPAADRVIKKYQTSFLGRKMGNDSYGRVLISVTLPIKIGGLNDIKDKEIVETINAELDRISDLYKKRTDYYLKDCIFGDTSTFLINKCKTWQDLKDYNEDWFYLFYSSQYGLPSLYIDKILSKKDKKNIFDNLRRLLCDE